MSRPRKQSVRGYTGPVSWGFNERLGAATPSAPKGEGVVTWGKPRYIGHATRGVEGYLWYYLVPKAWGPS